jgi:hypothetical protein
MSSGFQLTREVIVMRDAVIVEAVRTPVGKGKPGGALSGVGGAGVAAGTGVPDAKINLNGGAVAIGHPLGASGARIMTTLVNALEQCGARYGPQVMCEAGGLANATIIEPLWALSRIRAAGRLVRPGSPYVARRSGQPGIPGAPVGFCATGPGPVVGSVQKPWLVQVWAGEVLVAV